MSGARPNDQQYLRQPSGAHPQQNANWGDEGGWDEQGGGRPPSQGYADQGGNAFASSGLMNQLLEIAESEDASDLHLTAGAPPVLRINGRLVPVEAKVLTPDEAVDFARYYAQQAEHLGEIDGATFTPASLTAVVPPWNFPLAIPLGGVMAALAAGSAVILKPASASRRCGALLAEACWRAGIDKDLLQFVVLDDRKLGNALVTDPRVERVVLTGSSETAQMFLGWRPGLHLMAETSGKNATIVTESADMDLAVADVVASAFGHAGQKCSASSLVILVGSVGKSRRFIDQLVDAVSSLNVGWPTDPTTQMSPLTEVPGEKLLRGLTSRSLQDRARRNRFAQPWHTPRTKTHRLNKYRSPPSRIAIPFGMIDMPPLRAVG